jgi:anion transporter
VRRPQGTRLKQLTAQRAPVLRVAAAAASAAAEKGPATGIKIAPAVLSIAVGLIVRYVIPIPVGVSVQGWQLLSIFLATVTGLVAGPLPVGAWAFCALTFTVVTKTLTFQQAFAAYTNDVIWLIVIAFFFARGFVKTGLGDRVATMFVKFLGKSTLGLAYGLALSEALISPAMPSTTARAGGVYLPIITSLGNNAESYPIEDSRAGPSDGKSARKLSSFLIQAQLQCAGPGSALFMTAAAQNMLTMKLGQEVAGFTIANPWVTWLQGACVPALLTLLITPALLYLAYPPTIKDTPDAPAIADAKLKSMGPNKDGSLSRDEKLVCATMAGALCLWVGGDFLGIAPAITAMMGLCAFLVTGVLSWDDCLKETSAWDTLSWFAVLVGMSGMLNQLGIVKFFADTVAAALAAAHLGSMQVFFALNLAYYVMHYLFASQTAHVGALAPAFIGMMCASGVPPQMAILSIAYNTNLFGGITHYASGQSAVYYGAGYVSLPDYFKVGSLFGTLNWILFFTVGPIWWKLLGWL